MKRFLAFLSALVLCVSVCACGAGNIEKFCDGSSIKWNGAASQLVNSTSEVSYYATFEGGVLTIEKREPTPSADSPTGKLWNVVDRQAYSYELQGNDAVIINGKTYTYEIDGDEVIFGEKLLGIDDRWKK